MTYGKAMTLTDILRNAYVTCEPASRISERDGTITVEGDGYRLAIAMTTSLSITVEGKLNRDGFFALGLADEQTEGAISAALDRAERWSDAEQVRFSLDATQCGRGPIYARGEAG